MKKLAIFFACFLFLSSQCTKSIVLSDLSVEEFLDEIRNDDWYKTTSKERWIATGVQMTKNLLMREYKACYHEEDYAKASAGIFRSLARGFHSCVGIAPKRLGSILNLMSWAICNVPAVRAAYDRQPNYSKISFLFSLANTSFAFEGINPRIWNIEDDAAQIQLMTLEFSSFCLDLSERYQGKPFSWQILRQDPLFTLMLSRFVPKLLAVGGEGLWREYASVKLDTCLIGFDNVYNPNNNVDNINRGIDQLLLAFNRIVYDLYQFCGQLFYPLIAYRYYFGKSFPQMRSYIAYNFARWAIKELLLIGIISLLIFRNDVSFGQRGIIDRLLTRFLLWDGKSNFNLWLKYGPTIWNKVHPRAWLFWCCDKIINQVGGNEWYYAYTIMQEAGDYLLCLPEVDYDSMATLENLHGVMMENKMFLQLFQHAEQRE